MDISELQRKLLAAARSGAPSDSVPYAFEKRIMARLSGKPSFDHWSFWAQHLWRAAAPCLVLMLLLSLGSVLGLLPNSSRAPDLETAVLAPFNNFDMTW